MDIKIKCTAAEFAALVRDCLRCAMYESCNGCVFKKINGSCKGIEHLVSVELVEDGVADG